MPLVPLSINNKPNYNFLKSKQLYCPYVNVAILKIKLVPVIWLVGDMMASTKLKLFNGHNP
jgi:hypothetical protein